jgi:hypothetical protein
VTRVERSEGPELTSSRPGILHRGLGLVRLGLVRLGLVRLGGGLVSLGTRVLFVFVDRVKPLRSRKFLQA